ncbi:leishmanolysin-related zinc metalloendopeptidase [Fluviibacterium sp. DFM31]|uniref:Leishmanolysin-related zinc metalloendopeptidase n=1 Tax=Meridianimarinicoccus marinus TaxID=3231483 RepID=A0ABV3LBW9_9RHOB
MTRPLVEVHSAPATPSLPTESAPVPGGPYSGGPYFDINVGFSLPGLTNTQSLLVQNAYQFSESFFESVITGYQLPGPIIDPLNPGSFISAIDITASVKPIDGVGGAVGQAGPRQVVTYSSTAGDKLTYVTDGIMEFDAADVINLLVTGTFQKVVLHEMAHVLGFGTLWDPAFFDGGFAIYDKVNAPGQYVGSAALAKYQQEFGTAATFVPVEFQTSIDGTDHSHWSQFSTPRFAGGAHEIMTGFLNRPTYVSDTTLFAFRDLGYTTVDSLSMVSVPLPAGLLLLSGALLMLRGLRTPREGR